jgi:hypothetical protein
MPLRKLFEKWNAGEQLALEHYYRHEHLDAELASLRARGADHRQLTLERSPYAASSYFAA